MSTLSYFVAKNVVFLLDMSILPLVYLVPLHFGIYPS